MSAETDLYQTLDLHTINERQRQRILELEAALAAAQDTVDRARRIISAADMVVCAVEDALRKGYVLPVAADVISRAVKEYNEVE